MKWNRVLLALSLGLLVAAQSLSTTPTTTPAVQTLQSSQVSSATTAASQSKASGGADSGATQSDPGFEDPNEAGASGSDSGAFTMSKGGLIAIVTVVSVVAVFGIGSLILWYLAKKRSWEVRASLRRISRRFTGRMDDSRSKRQTRRTGIRMQSPPRSKNQSSRPRDLEKGIKPVDEKRKPSPASNFKPKTTTTISSTFDVETPAAQSWKSKLMAPRK